MLKFWNENLSVLYPQCRTSGSTVKQVSLKFARPETIIYTNLGTNRNVTSAFSRALGSVEAATDAELIINTYHLRARDELVNRALKEFETESAAYASSTHRVRPAHVPFKRFASNAAYYYLIVIAFFLFETFK